MRTKAFHYTILSWLAAAALLTTAAAGAAAQSQIHLRIYGNWPQTGADEPAYETLQHYLREYEAMHPHVTIEDLGREHSPSAVLALLISGTAPDLIALGNQHVLNFYLQGALEPVPERFAGLMRENLFPAAVEGSTIGGVIASVPTLNNISTLYYNRRALEESGLPPVPPATWAEVAEAGPRVARIDADGSFERAGLHVSTNWMERRLYELLLLAEGGAFVDADGRLAIDGEPLRRLIDRVVEWSQTFFFRGSSSIFASGNAAYSHASSGFLQSYLQRYPHDFESDIGAAGTPAGPAGRVEYQFSNGYAVPPGPNEEAVWDLLEWLYFSNDGPGGMTPQGHIFLERGIPPLHRGDVQAMLSWDPDLAPYYAAFIDNIGAATNTDSHFVEHGIAGNPLQDMFHAILNDGATPEQAITNLVTELQNMMADRRAQ